jgi:hypothetical protein
LNRKKKGSQTSNKYVHRRSYNFKTCKLQIFKLIRQARTQVIITKVEILVEDLKRENIHEPSAELKLGFQATIKAFSIAIKY